MIKVAVPHSPYLHERINRVPSLFIQELRSRIHKHDDFEYISLGDTPEEISNSLSSGVKPDIMICIAASGLHPKITHLFKRHNIKTVLFWDDLHWLKDHAKHARHRIFRNADLLLLPYHHIFVKMKEFQKYHHKSKFFPWFAPMECFSDDTEDQLWDNRFNKIVVSGADIKQIYPLRNRLFRYARKTPDKFNILKHPGYTHRGGKPKHRHIGPMYYRYLKYFKGAVVTSGIPPLDSITEPYTICKYFEIPGCGCTPFFEPVPELELLGFKRDYHYIPITNDSVFDIPIEETGNIAKNARDFVKEHHSAQKRCDELLQHVLDLQLRGSVK